LEVLLVKISKPIRLNGVSSWVNHTRIHGDGIPSEYHQLQQDQRDIGWYLVCLARLSVQWFYCQKSRDRNSQNNNDKSAVSSRTLLSQDLLQAMVETVVSVCGGRMVGFGATGKAIATPCVDES
jgi:hypothetical protein